MVGEGVGGVGEISTARPADVAASTFNLPYIMLPSLNEMEILIHVIRVAVA